jgi:hypothetical protein
MNGYTSSQIAEALGRKRQWVQWYLHGVTPSGFCTSAQETGTRAKDMNPFTAAQIADALGTSRQQGATVKAWRACWTHALKVEQWKAFKRAEREKQNTK